MTTKKGDKKPNADEERQLDKYTAFPEEVAATIIRVARKVGGATVAIAQRAIDMIRKFLGNPGQVSGFASVWYVAAGSVRQSTGMITQCSTGLGGWKGGAKDGFLEYLRGIRGDINSNAEGLQGVGHIIYDAYNNCVIANYIKALEFMRTCRNEILKTAGDISDNVAPWDWMKVAKDVNALINTLNNNILALGEYAKTQMAEYITKAATVRLTLTKLTPPAGVANTVVAIPSEWHMT